MGIFSRILKTGEGDRPLCVICRKRCKDNEIESDGLSVCKSCYDELMTAKTEDYYDTGNYLNRLFAPFTYGGKIRETILDLKFKIVPALQVF